MSIPQTPKRFRNWLDKQRPELPAKVYDLGVIHWLCLSMIAMNRSNADAAKAAKKISAGRMTEFMSAYADWRKSRS